MWVGSSLQCLINMLQSLHERIYYSLVLWNIKSLAPLLKLPTKAHLILVIKFVFGDACRPGPTLKIPFHIGNRANLNQKPGNESLGTTTVVSPSLPRLSGTAALHLCKVASYLT